MFRCYPVVDDRPTNPCIGATIIRTYYNLSPAANVEQEAHPAAGWNFAPSVSLTVLSSESSVKRFLEPVFRAGALICHLKGLFSTGIPAQRNRIALLFCRRHPKVGGASQ